MDPASPLKFVDVVEKVRSGEPDGLEELYRVFRMFKGSLRRQMGLTDFDDRIHDVFLMVVGAIRANKLREPAALPAFIHGVARLLVYSKLGIRARHQKLACSFRYWETGRAAGPSPEETAARGEKLRIMREMLESLCVREREILIRFYLFEQSKEQICREMSLTETQFRLAKSRAKQRLERRANEQLLAA